MPQPREMATRDAFRSEGRVINFQIGDQVRVVGLPHSEWHGVSGVVVNLIERPGRSSRPGPAGELTADESVPVQECAIQTYSGKRWFLAADLVRTVPDRALRLFRWELLDRWPGLSPDDVIALNGTRQELIGFLQERYGLGLKRASIEADAFISQIDSRRHTARETHSLSALKTAA